jgi:hypothetical protein
MPDSYCNRRPLPAVKIIGVANLIYSLSSPRPAVLKRCFTCGVFIRGFPPNKKMTRQGKAQERTFRSQLLQQQTLINGLTWVL